MKMTNVLAYPSHMFHDALMSIGFLQHQTTFEDRKSLSPHTMSLSNIDTLEHAQSLDQQDPLREFRSKFIIPSKADLKCTTIDHPGKPEPLPNLAT